MIRLDRCDGPECPRCGCRDTKILKEPANGKSWWDAGRAECRHCGEEFFFREMREPARAPAIVPLEQPDQTPISMVCGCGGRLKVYRTRGPIRYCKCESCKRTSKRPRAAI